MLFIEDVTMQPRVLEGRGCSGEKGVSDLAALNGGQ